MDCPCKKNPGHQTLRVALNKFEAIGEHLRIDGKLVRSMIASLQEVLPLVESPVTCTQRCIGLQKVIRNRPPKLSSYIPLPELKEALKDELDAVNQILSDNSWEKKPISPIHHAIKLLMRDEGGEQRKYTED